MRTRSGLLTGATQIGGATPTREKLDAVIAYPAAVKEYHHEECPLQEKETWVYVTGASQNGGRSFFCPLAKFPRFLYEGFSRSVCNARHRGHAV